MNRIVILGGGFAGIATAGRLEQLLRADAAEIVLISRENFSLFTPMLPEVSSGALDVRHVVTPIRTQLRRTRFVLADVDSVDLPAKRVSYTHTLTGLAETIEYDQLVITVGAGTSTFGLPGVAERVFALKTLEDAGILRNRLMWLLELADATDDDSERARLLTVAVVGGGFTGVETAGELVELFHSVTHFFPRVRRADVRIVLIEGGKSLLPGLPARMGSYSHEHLQKSGVRVITGDGVERADDDGLLLQSGERIETRTIVWSAGVKPRPIAGLETICTGKGGTIPVSPELRVPSQSGVWALGDCAAVPNDAGGLYPPTAQHAIREGPVAAENIAAALQGKPLKPFRYTSLGMMASLGARKAVAQLPGNRVLTGFLAWFLWRSYYLSRLPGLDRKLRVAFDWTLELLFPRDISELRVYSSRAQSSAAADAGLTPREESVLK
ncbi:MAG TPA: NAD(P)/FAD-dependent oxidoreductase [Candidatus Baltobacteraceae bacterium]|nr:NAD(P)/FAD-dependent oxidoreductase [Candidatus Baltobacteraceae bacterium]